MTEKKYLDGSLFTKPKSKEKIITGDWIEFSSWDDRIVTAYVEQIFGDVLVLKTFSPLESGKITTQTIRRNRERVCHSPLSLTQEQLKIRKQLFIDLSLLTKDEKMFKEANEGVIE